MGKRLGDMTLIDMVENCYYCHNNEEILESEDHCKDCIFVKVCGNIPEEFREYINYDTKRNDTNCRSINNGSINITCKNVYITDKNLGE